MKFRATRKLAFGALVLITVICTTAIYLWTSSKNNRLLLAPMIGQMEACQPGAALQSEYASDPAFEACQREGGSSAPVINSTLNKLGPQRSANGLYELGYTLNVPLLNFMVQRGDGWVLDQAGIARMVRTISQTDRHLVLYLFSTHYSSSAKIEPFLARDPANLAHTPRGPLGLDKHFGLDVYPWSIARTDNSLSKTRIEVISAITQALCDAPQKVRDRIAAITLLGEVHHLFPAFETGMGFSGAYEVSDYSNTSVLDFQAFLQERFHTIAALNTTIQGEHYPSFKDVQPPAKNIRTEPLRYFGEHIDSYASGHLPVQGWLAPDPKLTGWVQLFLNGKPLAKVQAVLGRQDVLAAIPALGSANVGWRHDLNFENLAPGIFEVAALAESHQGLPVLLAKREIAIMDRQQSTPSRTARVELPPHQLNTSLRGSVDAPSDQSNYFFNPLAKLWSEFRGQQVVNYQQFIEQPLKASCLAAVPRYIHQLFPYPNPSWDWGKFAVDESLRARAGRRLGVSLYGEASAGDSFLNWKTAQAIDRYGITEFHPLRAMSATELNQTMSRHKENGAQFLSFFLEGRGDVSAPYTPTGPTIPFIGEANLQNGSDQLYQSLQRLMVQPR